MITNITTKGRSFTRENYKWETANVHYNRASGDGFTWEDVVLIKEVWNGDTTKAVEALPEVKKRKLVRLIMRRKGIKLYDEYKEVSKLSARVQDIKLIIKEVKAKVELV